MAIDSNTSEQDLSEQDLSEQDLSEQDLREKPAPIFRTQLSLIVI
jgi:hypothetical protein